MKRMKSLHLFVVFASVALSYVILSACSSDDEYNMNNGLTLASGMMTRAEGDAGTYPGSSADSVMTAVIDEETVQVNFKNGISRPKSFTVIFVVKLGETKGYNAIVRKIDGQICENPEFTAVVSEIDIEKRTCKLTVSSGATTMYGESSGTEDKVKFLI